MRSSFGPSSFRWMSDSISVAGTPRTDVSFSGAQVCGFSTLPALAVSWPLQVVRTTSAGKTSKTLIAPRVTGRTIARSSWASESLTEKRHPTAHLRRNVGQPSANFSRLSLLRDDLCLWQRSVRDRTLFAEHFLYEFRPPVDLRLAGLVLLEGLPRPLVNLLSSFDRLIAGDSFPLERASSDLCVKDLVRPVVIVKMRG